MRQFGNLKRTSDFLTQFEVVQIEVPIQNKNPWLDKFGYFKDDFR